MTVHPDTKGKRMVDLIGAEVIRSRFEALISEMRFVLFRSAFSALMRESRDCSFGICSAEGEMPFEGMLNIYVYGLAARRLLAMVPIEEMHEGDIFIGNNPHEIGVQHSPDVLVMAPVFHAGTLVAFCGSIAHKSDIGGAVPGSVYSGATELYQEGLVLPLMKYYDRGRRVSQVEEVIRANVRNPDLVLGDLGAQIGATVMGAGRVKALAARYGTEVLADAFRQLLAAPEKRISQLVEKWPGHMAEAEALLDPLPNHDKPIRIHLRVTREGGHLVFDFSESDPQVRGAANVPVTAVISTCCTGVLGMTDPSVPENEGVARTISLVTKEGTVVSPTPPAPMGNTTMVNPRLFDVVVSALTMLKGEGLVAERGGHGTIALGWRESGLVMGRGYIQYEIQNSSGTGATGWSDGVGAVNPHSYCRDRKSLDDRGLPDAPIEVLESQYPVRIRRFELIQDSGGAGRFRGGVSRRRLYEALAPAQLNVRHSMGFILSPNGVAGGQPGRKGRVVVNPDTSSEVDVKGWSYELKPGDTLAFDAAGGGGFGDPFERDPQLILRDVVAGFVSIEGARNDYGVVVRAENGTLALDIEATQEFRATGSRKE